MMFQEERDEAEAQAKLLNVFRDMHMIFEGNLKLKPATGPNSANTSRADMFGMTSSGRKTYGSIFEKRKASGCLPGEQPPPLNGAQR